MTAVTFTIESDAIQGDEWREGVAELIDLFRSYPELVHVARTSGGRREASRPRKVGGVPTDSDLAAAAKRLALMDTLDGITETGVFGVSTFGDATYGGPEDHERMDKIQAALWPDKQAAPDLSEANDALHLATHLKYKRDHFVTTDVKILNAKERLQLLGIHVLTPSEAADLARSLCETKAESS